MAYNISYDVKVLCQEINRSEEISRVVPTPEDLFKKNALDVWCAYLLKRAFPGQYTLRRMGLKLTELHRMLFHPESDPESPSFQAHDALADAQACADCYFEFVKRELLPRVSVKSDKESEE